MICVEIGLFHVEVLNVHVHVEITIRVGVLESDLIFKSRF